MFCRDREVMLHGPAGTGKSRAWMEKIHLTALRYPGSRQLLVRKTRASLTQAALATFELHVLPAASPVLAGASRAMRQAYKYDNGSEIVCAGLDNPQKIMSSEYDRIYVQEATETNEADWEMLMTRLRNGKTPYHQICGDCNPDAPTHWIMLRENLAMIQSSHQDNPVLYNHKTGDWTPEGAEYIATLDQLSGHRRDRLRYGLWVSAEGARFNQLDSKVHLFDRQEVWPNGRPLGFRCIMGVDYGLKAPYCALWIAVDYDGDLWVYREDYEAGITADIQAKRMINLTDSNETIHTVYCDPAIWAVFPQHIPTAGKTLRSTADFYAAALTEDKRFGTMVPGFNKSRRVAMDTLDALLNRDNGYPDLHIERRACPNLWRELTGAVWDESGTKEDIDKDCDDHCLVAETMVLTKRGEVPICDVTTEDWVMTRKGWRKVTRSWKSGTGAPTVEVLLSNGRTLRGTPNHKVWSESRNSWVQMGGLERHELLCVVPNTLKQSSGMESRLGDTQVHLGSVTGCISDQTANLSEREWSPFTAKYGSRLMGRFLTGGTSTTKTGILPTTLSKIWNACHQQIIAACTFLTDANRAIRTSQRCLRQFAQYAANGGKHGCQRQPYALQSAGLLIGAGAGLTTWNEYADAGKCSRSTDFQKQSTARVHVLEVRHGKDADVYDLTVDGEHEFIAEGVIVHNSITALYYAVHTYLDPPDMPNKPLPKMEEVWQARGNKRDADTARRFNRTFRKRGRL